MSLALGALTGSFRSLKQAESILVKGQRQRFCLLHLSKEISSLARISYPEMHFRGDAESFFLIFVKEASLVESRYVYNSSNFTLEHYLEEPADYDINTYQAKEICLEGLRNCKFSYSDGQNWYESWQEDKEGLPSAIKIVYQFQGEDHAEVFIVNIPVSP